MMEERVQDYERSLLCNLPGTNKVYTTRQPNQREESVCHKF